MKNVILIALSIVMSSTYSIGREKPVTFGQLPASSQTFVNENFSNDPVQLCIEEDDFIRPDYEVRLASGTELEFDHSGALKKISSRSGVPAELIPDSIRKYVTALYPNARYVEYEIGRYTYDVTLSNGWELKFNSRFDVIEIDD
jgi:hypothetical protein